MNTGAYVRACTYVPVRRCGVQGWEMLGLFSLFELFCLCFVTHNVVERLPEGVAVRTTNDQPVSLPVVPSITHTLLADVLWYVQHPSPCYLDRSMPLGVCVRFACWTKFDISVYAGTRRCLGQSSRRTNFHNHLPTHAAARMRNCLRTSKVIILSRKQGHSASNGAALASMPSALPTLLLSLLLSPTTTWGCKTGTTWL